MDKIEIYDKKIKEIKGSNNTIKLYRCEVDVINIENGIIELYYCNVNKIAEGDEISILWSNVNILNLFKMNKIYSSRIKKLNGKSDDIYIEVIHSYIDGIISNYTSYVTKSLSTNIRIADSDTTLNNHDHTIISNGYKVYMDEVKGEFVVDGNWYYRNTY